MVEHPARRPLFRVDRDRSYDRARLCRITPSQRWWRVFLYFSPLLAIRMVQLGWDDLPAVPTEIPLLVVRTPGFGVVRPSLLYRLWPGQPVGPGHRSGSRRVLAPGHLYRIPTPQGQEGRLARCLPRLCADVRFRTHDRVYPEHGYRPNHADHHWIRCHRHVRPPCGSAILWLALQPW